MKRAVAIKNCARLCLQRGEGGPKHVFLSSIDRVKNCILNNVLTGV